MILNTRNGLYIQLRRASPIIIHFENTLLGMPNNKLSQSLLMRILIKYLCKCHSDTIPIPSKLRNINHNHKLSICNNTNQYHPIHHTCILHNGVDHNSKDNKECIHRNTLACNSLISNNTRILYPRNYRAKSIKSYSKHKYPHFNAIARKVNV